MHEKTNLLKLLQERSFLYKKEGFKLTSGKISPYYLDCKKTTLYAPALPLIGKLLWQEIKEYKDLQAVGGPTLGADPLIAAVCFQAGLEGYNLEGFIVRKEPKGHGTQQWLEGKIKPGMTCIILEDVVTTGKSSLKAVSKAQENGLEVKGVVCLVDRKEGGKEKIESQGLIFKSLFVINDFIE